MKTHDSIRYKILADCVLTLHLAINGYMIAGTIISFYYRPFALFHVFFVIALVLLNTVGGGCPLTRIEGTLRRRHDSDYQFGETFYGHYLFNKCLGISVTKNQVRIFLVAAKVLPGLVPLGILFGFY